jgi:predicted DNA-binding WGR domain protein
LRCEIFEEEEAAASAARRIVRRRLQHGYAERGHRIMLQDAVPAVAEAPKQGVFAPADTSEASIALCASTRFAEDFLAERHRR